jgi:hypothetical protein
MKAEPITVYELHNLNPLVQGLQIRSDSSNISYLAFVFVRVKLELAIQVSAYAMPKLISMSSSFTQPKYYSEVEPPAG